MQVVNDGFTSLPQAESSTCRLEKKMLGGETVETVPATEDFESDPPREPIPDK
jgi:hypothetical protein